MWPQVIDLFPSKQVGIAGMTISFSIAPFLFSFAPLNSVEGGIDRMEWQANEPRQLSHQNGVHTLFFLVVGDCVVASVS